jgi:hypothetical protein
MIKTEEMMNNFIRFGRKDIQDFVAKSRDVKDAVTYLRMEFEFEIDRITTFITADSHSFEKKKGVEVGAHQIGTVDRAGMFLPSLIEGVYRKEG